MCEHEHGAWEPTKFGSDSWQLAGTACTPSCGSSKSPHHHHPRSLAGWRLPAALPAQSLLGWFGQCWAQVLGWLGRHWTQVLGRLGWHWAEAQVEKYLLQRRPVGSAKCWDAVHAEAVQGQAAGGLGPALVAGQAGLLPAP